MPRGFFPPPPSQRGPAPTPSANVAAPRSIPGVPSGYHRVTMDEMAQVLNRAVVRAPAAIDTSLKEAAEVIQTEAKRVIGTYEYGWPPLKPETVARKQFGDTPLLETGELRDSIEIGDDVIVEGKERSIAVGSNNPKAIWHELGTATIPARSFLKGAAMRKEQEVQELVGKSVTMRMFKFGELLE